MTRTVTLAALVAIGVALSRTLRLLDECENAYERFLTDRDGDEW